MVVTWAAPGALCAALIVWAPAASAQTTDNPLGGADTLFAHVGRTPISYLTSYERDVSTGTWTQTLSYSLTRPRFLFSTSGIYSAVDYTGGQGLGSSNGDITGRLSFRAVKNLYLNLDGDYGKLSSHDIVSESTQRRDRLKISTQYNVTPIRTLTVRTFLSSEFQQDHTLTVRPLGFESARTYPVVNGLGDTVRTDTIFVTDQRDSTFMSGRQDGMTGQVEWKPKPWFDMLTDVSGSRVTPKTDSFLRDFGRASDNTPAQHVTPNEFESPNDNTSYRTKLTYAGAHATLSTLTLNMGRSNQQFFEQLLRSQEHLSNDQRRAALHVERSAFRGAIISMDGTLDRSLSVYTLRANRSSLVAGKSLQASLAYNPSYKTRAGLTFNLDDHRNSRQQTGNGLNHNRFLSANSAYRLTRRLGVDAVGTVSLSSYQYADSVLDQDNLRSYLSLGGGYQVSAACSTTVHFSRNQGHVVAIDASRSGNNNVQSTYQLDATLRVGLGPKLAVSQNYLLNAVYQIYDAGAAESRNVLSRIRRIDTTFADSIFTFATLQFVHNFLFRDSGSYTRASPGEGRAYSVGSETYQQSVSAALNVRPAAGVQMFATQSLGDTKTRFPATGVKSVNNRWTLALGATVNRTILGNANLNGTVQHVGAYTERQTPADVLQEQNDWIAGVTLTKDF
jgi:hypothetical protein